MTDPARTRAERTLHVAEKAHEVLAAMGVECAVIGGLALAFHNYVRDTADFDLGIGADPALTLRAFADRMDAMGFRTEVRYPEAGDPLGGVVDVLGDDFDLIQLVNFYNPFGGRSSPGVEAVRTATLQIPESPLRVVDLPHLIALKLYAGGRRSENDVIELLERNRPTLDMAKIEDVCARFGLDEPLKKIRADLRL